MEELTSKVDISDWSIEEKKKLLSSILEAGGSSNKRSYKSMEASIKWEDIKLDGKSAEECKAMYQKLISKVRRFRTMQEIITDAFTFVADEPKKPQNEFPDLPKKPLTAFSLFVRKRSKKFPDMKGSNRMKVFANDWNNLSEEKKEAYKKKYMRQKKKYEEEFEMFRQNHPEYQASVVTPSNRPQPPIPSKLFVESRLEKIKSKKPELSHAEAVKKLTDKYKNLSDRKKLKWINKAVNLFQTYQEECKRYLASNPRSTLKSVELHLSKDEQRILNSSKGKPASTPPKNLFMYFCNTKRDGMHHLSISEQSTELSLLYHQLTEDELKDLHGKFKQEVEDYIQAYTNYYQSLSEEEKKREKPPEEALAVYCKIVKEVQNNKKRKKKKSKNDLAEFGKTNGGKVKLSDLLPRPNVDTDASASDSDDTSPPSDVATPTKRKHHEDSVAPHKKKKIDPDIVSASTNKATNKAAIDEDALLAMWSPLKSDVQSQNENMTDQQRKTTHKSPKKAKKPKS